MPPAAACGVGMPSQLGVSGAWVGGPGSWVIAERAPCPRLRFCVGREFDDGAGQWWSECRLAGAVRQAAARQADPSTGVAGLKQAGGPQPVVGTTGQGHAKEHTSMVTTFSACKSRCGSSDQAPGCSGWPTQHTTGHTGAHPC